MPKSEKGGNSNIYRILPKVNQVIYTMDTIYEPNIMILALAVLQIFYSQGSIGLQWESRKNVELELVFVKHYAPNICLSPNMAKFAVAKFHKKFWTLLKCLTCNLHIIPYQLTKFQATSSNSFRDILLTSLKCPNFQRAITPQKYNDFFFYFNQVIYSSSPISWPSFKHLA